MNIRGFLDKVAATVEALGGAKINLSEPAIELLLPNVLRFAVKDMMSRGANLQDVVKSHKLEFLGGQADLPANILTEFIKYFFLPDYKLSSLVPHLSDYNRGTETGGGLTNKFCYFAIENGKIYSNCPIPQTIRNLEAIIVSETSPTFGALESLNLTASDLGKRIRITNGDVLLADAIIDSIDDPNTGRIRGGAIESVISNIAEAVVYDTSTDTVVRELEDILIAEKTNTFATGSPTLTPADIGRRFRIYDGTTLIVDAYLLSVESSSAGTLSATALVSSTGTATATVLSPRLILNAPTVPLVPESESAAFDANEELINKAVEIMVAILRGEIPLVQITEEKS